MHKEEKSTSSTNVAGKTAEIQIRPVMPVSLD
jgi:hypothetical protein